MVFSRASMTTQTIGGCPFHGEIRGKLLFHVTQYIIFGTSF